MNKTLILGAWILLLVSGTLGSAPFPGMEFYGKVMHLGRYASPGTIITAHFLDGTICGETTVEKVGQYSMLSCYGNSSRIGEQIVFRVNYDKANSSLNSYVPGTLSNVNLFDGNYTQVVIIPRYNMCKWCLLKLVVITAGVILVLLIAYGIGKWIQRKASYGLP